MSQLSKIDSMAATNAKKNGSSFANKNKSSSRRNSPAFQGAKFDRRGYCLHHTSVKLVKPIKDDSGKLVYQEMKTTCPSCQAAKYKCKRSTSLGGGKVKVGHRIHGASTPSSRSLSRSRSMSRERGNNGQPLERKNSTRSRSKSRDRSGNSRRPEQSTPFDSKGRCHYHKNVTLAAKKMRGGWKVLHSVCPKCIEDQFDDDRSVKSGTSRKSSRSEVSGGSGARGDACGQFDKNGCCVLHPHVQVAKKRVFGTGFKVVRVCPSCCDRGDDEARDDRSVRSGKSASSGGSVRSVRSSASRANGLGGASKSGRYGVMPFDRDGYCCRHPNVQLAKKKALGGFKIVHDVCPECNLEDTRGVSFGRKKKSSSRNGTGRVFDDSGSETSSYKSGKSKKSGVAPGKRSISVKKKRTRIRVRNLKIEDDQGGPGRYSGYVNDDHQPHGNGIIKYADGMLWEGVWSDGSKVHGKTKNDSTKKKTDNSSKQ